MKALVIGDVHLADHAPSIRNDTYAQDILAKLDHATRLAVEHGCDVIVQAGDMFHVKVASRTSHRLVQQAHEVLTSAGLPVLVVPGNHDMQHDRIESLDSQPLGALCRMRGVEMLIGPHPDFAIFGLPYLSNWGAQLGTWMGYYTKWLEKYEAIDTTPLMVTHAPIFPSGQTPPYEFIDAADWAEQMLFGACYYAHIHDPHGFYRPTASVLMGNVGALSRGSLHEATLRRKPAVTLFDSDAKESFTRIEVPHRPIEEVFALAARHEDEVEAVQLTQFLDGLDSEVIETTSVEAVVAHLRTLSISTETRDQAQELVEWASQ